MCKERLFPYIQPPVPLLPFCALSSQRCIRTDNVLLTPLLKRRSSLLKFGGLQSSGPRRYKERAHRSGWVFAGSLRTWGQRLCSVYPAAHAAQKISRPFPQRHPLRRCTPWGKSPSSLPLRSWKQASGRMPLHACLGGGRAGRAFCGVLHSGKQ